jgi:hypothetical protein
VSDTEDEFTFPDLRSEGNVYLLLHNFGTFLWRLQMRKSEMSLRVVQWNKGFQ